LNLLDDGSDRFRIDFAGLTHEIPSSMPTIFARDNQGRIATIVSGSSATIQPVAPFSLIVPFNQFPSFDWTNIQSIEITVSRYGGGIGAAGKSFTLDKIVTIPEPAGSAAIWIGLATALMTFFRRIHG